MEETKLEPYTWYHAFATEKDGEVLYDFSKDPEGNDLPPGFQRASASSISARIRAAGPKT